MRHIHSLTEGPIAGGLLRLSAPVLFTNLLQFLNGSINSIWVGHYLGEAALAATSNANLVLFLLLGAGLGIMAAATILIGQRIGAGDLAGARSAVGATTVLFAGTSILFGALGLIFSRPVLALLSTPAPSLPLAVSYMRVIFLAVPPFYIYAFVMAALRAVGDSKTPLYFMMLSIALDIALNPLLMFGFGPLPGLGITGSALATLTAQVASLAGMLIHLYRRGHPLFLTAEDLRQSRISWSLLKTLLCKGMPISAQLFLVSLSGVLMISIVNRLGVDTTAAYAAALQLWCYVQMPAQAVAQGVSAMAAQSIGAAKWDRVNRIAAVGVSFSVILTGTVVVAVETMGARAFSPFLPTGSPALRIATHLDSIVASSYVLVAIPTVLFAVVRPAGLVIAPLAITTTSLLVARYSIAELSLGVFGANAIWWSYPISTTLAAILAALYYRLTDWQQVSTWITNSSRNILPSRGRGSN